ncbi:transcriptional regulator [Pseudorhizobium halotolerans]|uniref:Transcriptional regulator n=1 Tax=Pseudorhizobium halotolerans TaxID=1233081 RepID=A0ABM8PDP9_9HYPH|nr:ChrR family anti-sigma-E factor [Pseudorhizobium halotolerans]CAD7023810.1 transcriptional regulator [Pseudorhizobium halotolerans]
MKVRHHISEEMLLDYAAGTLSEGWSIAIASHLALCPACRNHLSAMEGAAGALLDKISVSDDLGDSWNRFRTRLKEKATDPEAAAPGNSVRAVPPGTPSAVLPEPLRSYVGSDVDGLKWRALGRGAYQIRIPTSDPSTQVRLLRIPAGKPVPEHTHRGRELTLVLSGSFRDGNKLFERGDMEEADDDLLHTPVATEGEDCICLAVTEAPLKFTSWIVRMIQPILKI